MGVGSTFTSAARESLGELGQSGKGEPGISEQPRLARRSLSTSLIHPTRPFPSGGSLSFRPTSRSPPPSSYFLAAGDSLSGRARHRRSLSATPLENHAPWHVAEATFSTPDGSSVPMCSS